MSSNTKPRSAAAAVSDENDLREWLGAALIGKARDALAGRAIALIMQLIIDDQRDDSLRRIEKKLDTLLQAPFGEGIDELRDAEREQKLHNRRAKVERARAKFLQAKNQTEGAAAARAAGYVSLCYDYLGENNNSDYWIKEAMRISFHYRDARTKDYMNAMGGRLHAFFTTVIMFTIIGSPFVAAMTIMQKRRALSALNSIIDIEKQMRCIHERMKAKNIEFKTPRYGFSDTAIHAAFHKKNKMTDIAVAIDDRGRREYIYDLPLSAD